MITPADDDFGDGADTGYRYRLEPDHAPDPDDPLTVVLRSTHGHLVPPPGRYEEIRRGASRRRTLRAAAGAGLTCAVIALAVLVPLRMTARDTQAPPAVPLAPPPASSPSAGATTPAEDSPRPAKPTPTVGTVTPVPDTRTPGARDDTAAPSKAPSEQSTAAERRTAPTTSSAADTRR
ncbi:MULTISPECIES: hypothetical protein [Streptomyces]|uniref:Serine/threonine protein kinase n=2 Tax=Streptomyces TaxID=1883 RepID=A0ABV9J810_9ACTN